MNERIKELAEQAKEYADTKYSKLVSASRWGDCVPGIRELYTEKLAELIVRECAIKISNERKHFNPTEWDQGADWGHKNSIDVLKKHFGVEE